MGVESWTVLGHSFGSDLAVRYALDHPERVCAVVGVAGHGLHKDRTWSETYAAARHTEDEFAIEWDPVVHESLNAINVCLQRLDLLIAWAGITLGPFRGSVEGVNTRSDGFEVE